MQWSEQEQTSLVKVPEDNRNHDPKLSLRLSLSLSLSLTQSLHRKPNPKPTP